MNPVLSTVTPVFAIVLLGFILARVRILSAATSDGLISFMFYAAVPALLFRSLAAATLPASVPWGLIAAFYLPSFSVFLLGAVIARALFTWPAAAQGIAAVSASYSNMVMLGLPLVLIGFGPAASVPMFILLALQSSLLFPATTWMIEVRGRAHDEHVTSNFALLRRLLFNPIILSLAAGLGANLMSVSITGTLARAIDMLADAGPACALFALGASLARYDISGDLRLPLMLAGLKNIVHPALVAVACWGLSVPPAWSHVAILLAAMPTGINAFIFARYYALEAECSAKTIVISTLISLITIPLLIASFLPA